MTTLADDALEVSRLKDRKAALKKLSARVDTKLKLAERALIDRLASEGQKNINPDRVAGTCQWLLSYRQYLR